MTRYIEAVESADDERIGALLAEDVRVSHAAGAGGNLTGAASYLRMPGKPVFEGFALNAALTVVDGQITEVASYAADLFARFSLAERGTELELRPPRSRD